MDRSEIKYTIINNTKVPLCRVCNTPVETDPMPWSKTTAKLLCKKHEHLALKKNEMSPEIRAGVWF